MFWNESKLLNTFSIVCDVFVKWRLATQGNYGYVITNIFKMLGIEIIDYLEFKIWKIFVPWDDSLVMCFIIYFTLNIYLKLKTGLPDFPI